MKSKVIILASAIFFIFNLVLAGDPGPPPKEKEWKGKGDDLLNNPDVGRLFLGG